MTYNHPLFYKDGLTGKVEITVIKTDTPSLIEIGAKATKFLEGKAVEWAFISAADWIVKPEDH
jgi:hypothetical protein